MSKLRSIATRISAAALGVLLALALVGPIQAQRLMAAICASDTDAIYSQLQYAGISRERVERNVAAFEGYSCEQFGWRGAYVGEDGTVRHLSVMSVVGIGTEWFLLQYDLGGQLESLE